MMREREKCSCFFEERERGTVREKRGDLGRGVRGEMGERSEV